MQDRGDASAKNPEFFSLSMQKLLPYSTRQWRGIRRGLFEVSFACRRILPVRLVVLTAWTTEILQSDCPNLLGGAYKKGASSDDGSIATFSTSYPITGLPCIATGGEKKEIFEERKSDKTTN